MLLRTLFLAAVVFASGMGTLRASVLLESYPLLAGGMMLLAAGMVLVMRQEPMPSRRPRTA